MLSVTSYHPFFLHNFSIKKKESTSPNPITKSVVSSELLEKELKEIVFFYKDNSYKIFKN